MCLWVSWKRILARARFRRTGMNKTMAKLNGNCTNCGLGLASAQTTTTCPRCRVANAAGKCCGWSLSPEVTHPEGSTCDVHLARLAYALGCGLYPQVDP